jgi:hypothetical protein
VQQRTHRVERTGGRRVFRVTVGFFEIRTGANIRAVHQWILETETLARA